MGLEGEKSKSVALASGKGHPTAEGQKVKANAGGREKIVVELIYLFFSGDHSHNNSINPLVRAEPSCLITS